MVTDRRHCDDCEEETLHVYIGEHLESGDLWACQVCRAEGEARTLGQTLPTTEASNDAGE